MLFLIHTLFLKWNNYASVTWKIFTAWICYISLKVTALLESTINKVNLQIALPRNTGGYISPGYKNNQSSDSGSPEHRAQAHHSHAPWQLVHAVFWQIDSHLPYLLSLCAGTLEHGLWQASCPLWPCSTEMVLSIQVGTLLHRDAQLRGQLRAIFLNEVQSTSCSCTLWLYYCPRQRSYPQLGKTQHGEKQPITTAKGAFESLGHTIPLCLQLPNA